MFKTSFAFTTEGWLSSALRQDEQNLAASLLITDKLFWKDEWSLYNTSPLLLLRALSRRGRNKVILMLAMTTFTIRTQLTNWHVAMCAERTGPIKVLQSGHGVPVGSAAG